MIIQLYCTFILFFTIFQQETRGRHILNNKDSLSDKLNIEAPVKREFDTYTDYELAKVDQANGKVAEESISNYSPQKRPNTFYGQINSGFKQSRHAIDDELNLERQRIRKRNNFFPYLQMKDYYGPPSSYIMYEPNQYHNNPYYGNQFANYRHFFNPMLRANSYIYDAYQRHSYPNGYIDINVEPASLETNINEETPKVNNNRNLQNHGPLPAPLKNNEETSKIRQPVLPKGYNEDVQPQASPKTYKDDGQSVVPPKSYNEEMSKLNENRNLQNNGESQVPPRGYNEETRNINKNIKIKQHLQDKKLKPSKLNKEKSNKVVENKINNKDLMEEEDTKDSKDTEIEDKNKLNDMEESFKDKNTENVDELSNESFSKRSSDFTDPNVKKIQSNLDESSNLSDDVMNENIIDLKVNDKEANVNQNVRKRSNNLITDDNIKDLKSELKRAQELSDTDKVSEIEENLRDILEDMGLVEEETHDSAKKRAAMEDEDLEQGDNYIKLNHGDHKKRESKAMYMVKKKRDHSPQEEVLTEEEMANLQSKTYSKREESKTKEKIYDTASKQGVNKEDGKKVKNKREINNNENVQQISGDKIIENKPEEKIYKNLETKRESEEDVKIDEDKQLSGNLNLQNNRNLRKRRVADYRKEGETYIRSKRGPDAQGNEEIMKGLEKSGELTVSGNKSPLATSESQNNNHNNNNNNRVEEKPKRRVDEEERYEREIEEKIQKKINEIKEKVKREIETREKKDDDDTSTAEKSEIGIKNQNIAEKSERKKRELMRNTLLNNENSDIDPEMHSEELLSPHVRKRREAPKNSGSAAGKAAVAQAASETKKNAKNNEISHNRRKRTNALIPYNEAAFVPVNAAEDEDTDEGSEYDDNAFDDTELQGLRKRHVDSAEQQYENSNEETEEDATSNFESNKMRRSDPANEQTFFARSNVESAISDLADNAIDSVYANEDDVDDRSNRYVPAELKDGAIADLHSGGAAVNHLSKMRQRDLMNSRDRYARRKRNTTKVTDSKSQLVDSNEVLRINELSDEDLFGALPQGFHGEISRYKRVKKNIIEE